MNTIEAMQMTACDLAELERDRRLRDEIINEAVNALDVIARGRGAAGEKISRPRYAREAAMHIRQRWAQCDPIHDSDTSD